MTTTPPTSASRAGRQRADSTTRPSGRLDEMETQTETKTMSQKKPKNYDDLYPGRFLKAGNFNGQKVTLTIKDYDLETLEGENGEKKAKAIIHFEETPR